METLVQKIERNQAPSIRTETKYNSTRKSICVEAYSRPNILETLVEKAVAKANEKDIKDFELVEAHLYKHKPLGPGKHLYELYVAFNTLDNQLTLW